MTADRLVLLLAVGACAVAVLGTILLLRSGRELSALLVGASGVLMNAQVGGAHAFTLVTFVWLFLTRRGTGRDRVIRVAILLACAVLLAFTTLYGDLVNSRTLALQLLALSLTAGALAIRAEAGDTRMILHGALLTVTMGATLGLLQVMHVVPAASELWHSEVSEIGRPTGIWPEPDWLGLFSAVGLVLAWRLALSPVVRMIALLLNGMGCLLAFARAAWVALAVSIAIAALVRFVTSLRRDNIRKRAGPAIALLVSVGVVLVSTPVLRADLARRLQTLVSTAQEDISGQARIQQTEGLLTLGRTAAPFGHGLSASGRVGVSGRLYIGVTPEGNNNVASNWILAMWVDGALLALPLVFFLLTIAIRGAPLLSGQVLVLVLVNSFWSNAVFLPVTWLFLGLTMRALPVWTAPTRLPSLAPHVAHRSREVRPTRTGDRSVTTPRLR